MTVNARQVALEMVSSILDKGAYANLEAYGDPKLSRLSDVDKRFALEITYGTTKHWNTLDWVLGKFLSRPLEKVDPLVRNVLRTGAYQLLYMDKVPASAACDESVKIIKRLRHQGVAGFVNGVLRSISRKYDSIQDIPFPDIEQKPADYISLRYSYPRWMVQRWLDNFGLEGTIAICRYGNKPPRLSVRVNTLKTTVEDFTSLLDRKGISWSPGEICPESVVIYDYGKLEKDRDLHPLYLTQGESSMLVSHVLEPAPGQKVLDACSAPGSKTTHIAQLMGDEGKITAADVHEHRLNLVKNNCSRLGIGSVETLLCDAREISEKTAEKYDCVLVDAPCSGTGVLNRRADARWRRKPEDILSMSLLQKEILEKVLDLVKPGGRLVYSTCSLEPEENEEVVDYILRKHPDFTGEPFGGCFPSLGFNKDAYAVQVAPHTHETDGFFITRLVRH
ncbi:MAG: 16S rRNA (cytosine(967)-C(5))-methyltransferase RsmB [Bacillota bacterium]|jgi:16S rRNA (cytosine967-C5)-methyltransferase